MVEQYVRGRGRGRDGRGGHGAHAEPNERPRAAPVPRQNYSGIPYAVLPDYVRAMHPEPILNPPRGTAPMPPEGTFIPPPMLIAQSRFAVGNNVASTRVHVVCNLHIGHIRSRATNSTSDQICMRTLSTSIRFGRVCLQRYSR